jgi:hypothetical protein
MTAPPVSTAMGPLKPPMSPFWKKPLSDSGFQRDFRPLG